MKKTISIGSDHAGFELKEKIKEHLTKNGFWVYDKGCNSKDSCDYADFAHKVCQNLEKKESTIGILICGSGNGINMSANKWKSVRSAICWNSEIATLARLHNDANILTLPARFITEEEAINCVDVFLSTEFEGGRHLNRIEKIVPDNTDSNFFFISKTERSPHISINRELCKVEISGRSIPENAHEFYSPVFKQLALLESENIILNIDLEYFNSSSNKCLFDIINSISPNGQINWYCDQEDEDLIELIKEMKIKFNINLIIKENV